LSIVKSVDITKGENPLRYSKNKTQNYKKMKKLKV